MEWNFIPTKNIVKKENNLCIKLVAYVYKQIGSTMIQNRYIIL